MFTYVLHHAASDAVSLLREAARVARRRVLVLEDLQGDDEHSLYMQYHHAGCARNYTGTNAGGACIFRGAQEYKQLFELIGLRVVAQADPGRYCTHDAWTIPKVWYELESVR